MAVTHKRQPLPTKETDTSTKRMTANPILANVRALEDAQVTTWRKPLLTSQLKRPLYGWVKCVTMRQ